MKSTGIRSIVVAAAVMSVAFSVFAQTKSANGDLVRAFATFDVVRLSGSSIVSSPTASRKLTFAGTRNFEIELMPHDLRAAGFRSENTGIDGDTVVERAAVTTFRGRVTGDSASEARLNIVNSRIEGYFKSGGETFFVEPTSKYSPAANTDEYVIYKASDVLFDQSLSCGAYLAEKIERGRSLVSGSSIATVAGIRRIEIATEADFEYVTTLGGITQANQEILGILNTIEGLYANELNLSISVVFQHTWTTADPFAGANTEATVRNFQAYWNANFPPASYPRDAAQLFSAKSNVLSQGWAFFGVICNNPTYAYGMSGYIDWAPGKYLLTGHELGHNLGATHSDTAPNCANSLMNAFMSGTTPLSFCQASRNEVASFVTANGTCLTPGSSCNFDFDGDSMADISIFRPASGEWWYLKSSNGGNAAAQFGTSGDAIMPGDFTGDGKTDMAFFRPATGFWYVLRSDDSSFYAFPFGSNGDIPAPADYDGDGRADAAVFRPATSTWYISKSSGGTDIVGFGASSDKPVVGDYDGDGKSDLAVFRSNGGVGEWWIRRSSDLTVFATQFGSGTDKAVAGDYTGDGKTDIALWRPSNGNWFILRSENSSFYAFPFGSVGDIPSPGDYDGDGKFDTAVFRPSSATWFANRSSAGIMIQQFGAGTDIPVPNAFVR